MNKRVSSLTMENNYFSAHREGPVVVFSMKGNFLLSFATLNAKASVLDYFKAVDDHPEARIVVILGNPRKARKEEYLSFFDMVASSRIPKDGVLRVYRAIDEFVLHIMSSDTFFIDANCGQILPIFANIALACDYRVTGENAVFQNPTLELGLVAKGGAGWHFSRLLSKGKAYELMLADNDIPAAVALALGFIDRCVPAEDLETEAMDVARRFAALPASSLRLAKRMLNHTECSMADYLEFENRELMKAINEKAASR